MRDDVTIFLDMSNVFIGAQQAVPHSIGGSVRLCFPALMDLAAAGRPVDAAVAVATCTGSNDRALEAVRSAGWLVLVSEPGALSRREQNVDERLQLQMLCAARKGPPGRAVLLTGDGAETLGGDGFVDAVEALADSGWSVEVLSWRRCLSSRLVAVVAEVGGRCEELDPFWRSITFEEGGRLARPLSLIHRRPFRGPLTAY